ncbi:unnamed protein product [Adineta ricciae]|uniref:NHL repeat containing protein n=1 Tax=Adineta ricciae TaxID=249248 RepID=A0A813YVN8_ADIRI|nr:unnamed protein product [Adineta ricciae]CAF0889656.1 unnamed protein product [Adineta ricciae]
MTKDTTYHARSKQRHHRSHSRSNRRGEQTPRIIHVSIRSGAKKSFIDKNTRVLHKDMQSTATHTENLSKIINDTELSNKSAYSTKSFGLHACQPSTFLNLNQYSSNRISPEIDDHSMIPEQSSNPVKSKIFHLNSSRIGTTKDYHCNMTQKKKTKYKNLRIGLLILLGLILLLSLIIIPSVLLTRTKPKTTFKEAVLRWNPSGTTVAGITGTTGITNRTLNMPYALAIDYLNTLYITEYVCHRVQRWFRDASSGTTVAGNANCIAGSNLIELRNPATILLDSDNNMYIADSGNARVLFWPNGSSSGIVIAGTGFLSNGSNQPCTAFGISRDTESDTLYVADYGNSCIMRYLANATSATVVAGGNGAGLGSSQLYTPTSVNFEASSNSLVITNYPANNIVRWKIGDNGWTLIAGSTSGLYGSTSSLLYSPLSTAIDPMGNVYVADTLNHRIQFFLLNETSGTTIAGVATIPGVDATHLSSPYGLALDNQLNLYVTDTLNHRVQKFLRY